MAWPASNLGPSRTVGAWMGASLLDARTNTTLMTLNSYLQSGSNGRSDISTSHGGVALVKELHKRQMRGAGHSSSAFTWVTTHQQPSSLCDCKYREFQSFKRCSFYRLIGDVGRQTASDGSQVTSKPGALDQYCCSPTNFSSVFLNPRPKRPRSLKASNSVARARHVRRFPSSRCC